MICHLTHSHQGRDSGACPGLLQTCVGAGSKVFTHFLSMFLAPGAQDAELHMQK